MTQTTPSDHEAATPEMKLQPWKEKDHRITKHNQIRTTIKIKQPKNYVMSEHGIIIKEQQRLITFDEFDIVSILLLVKTPMEKLSTPLPALCEKTVGIKEIQSNLKDRQDNISKELTLRVKAAIKIHDEALEFLSRCQVNNNNCSLVEKYSIRRNKKRFLGLMDTILSIVGLTKSQRNSRNIALITNHINQIAKRKKDYFCRRKSI